MGGDHLRDAIGAIGEVAGAISVIFTLIYLAGQPRQNTNAIRMGAASERFERDYEPLNSDDKCPHDLRYLIFRGRHQPLEAIFGRQLDL